MPKRVIRNEVGEPIGNIDAQVSLDFYGY